FLWGYAATMKEEMNRSARILYVSAFALGLVAISQYFVFFTLLYKTSLLGISAFRTMTDATILPITFLYLVCTIGYGWLLYFLRKKRGLSLWGIICGIFALPFLCLATGIAGYRAEYALYITPAAVAIFLHFVRKNRSDYVTCVFSA